MPQFPEERFQSSEQLIARLQEIPDDIASIVIMVPNDLPLRGPEGQTTLARNCCGLIKGLDGTSAVIHRDELQTFINHELTRKLRVPITLIPQTAVD